MQFSRLEDPSRLAVLESLALLRPHEDPSFDRVTSIAAAATCSPTSLITFVGLDGQWIASRTGWQRDFHPLLESFCVHALSSSELLEVPDAALDPRFAANALVTGPDAVRFYAGHPIAFEGQVLGTVCVLDTRARRLAQPQAMVLQHLADLVGDLLRERRERHRSTRLSQALERSETTLAKSEERYRALWQTTTDAVLIVDEAGRILFANPAVTAAFGQPLERLVGAPLSLLQPERLRPAHDRGFLNYLRTGRRTLDWRAVEAIGLRADGTEFPIEVAFSELEVGRRRQFAAFIRDISERKKVQAELAYRAAQFKALTELSIDWYWELDSELRFTVMSDGARGSGLMEPREAIGKHPWEARSNDDAEHWRRHEVRLRHHEPFRDVEFIHRGPAGDRYILQISGEPVFSANGAFLGYRGVGRDVTAQRDSEEAKRLLEAQLLESQKLEAIGVLASGIAHDFNNVIAGVLGNAQLALADLDSDHPARHSLEQIQKAGSRARDMVRQILTFARRQPRQLAHFELRSLVEEALGLLRAALPAKVELSMDLPAAPIDVYADATQLEQVLINLVTNASQAMEGSAGHIVVRGEDVVVGREASAVPRSVAPGRYVHVAVQDDGPGMDEDTALRVFEPFFTTKAEGKGTGLGLSVVHGIVAGHGGMVSVDSSPGSGCTFHIWLPCGPDEEPTVPAPLSASIPGGDGRAVMYVDDDEVMVLMVPRLLEKAGYRVHAFSDVDRAVLAFRAQPEAYDVVVTDLNMPGMSGLEFARALTSIRPALPVILGSGNLPQELTDDVDFTCVTAVFHKQNTLEELPGLVADALSS